MVTCTFFGHRDCPDSVRAQLADVVEELIVRHGTDVFYVGDSGQFDAMAHGVLREMACKYPHVCYGVVLSTMPKGEQEADTMFPEGLECVPPRFAIDRRNCWMLERADFVICYVTHGWGGAAKWSQKARAAKKTVIDLAPYARRDG